MYRKERISESRLNDLVYLYQKSFGKKIEIGFLKKKFNTQAFGASYIGYIAYDEVSNEPAAFYGVFPHLVIKNGIKTLVAQSGDTMTNPAHQGKGLFTGLARLTYELAEKEGIKLIWGIPNKNSYPGFTKKLNWVDKGPLIKFAKKVNTLPIEKAIRKLNIQFLNRLYFGFCKLMFIQSIEKKGFEKPESKVLALLKDPDYFKYKQYFDNRMVLKYKNELIWVKIENGLLIGDYSFTSSKSFTEFVQSLKLKCFLLGITEISFICNSNHPLYNDLLSEHSLRSEESLPYCFLSGQDDQLGSELAISFSDLDTF